MGYNLQEYLSKASNPQSSRRDPSTSSSEYLISLHSKISALPSRNDIKGLLQKCVYSILVDENVEEEIQFLREVKKLLNQIRVGFNPDHVEIIALIEEIYSLAVDQKLDENMKVGKEGRVAIERDILSLFETNNDIEGDSDVIEDEEDEEAELGDDSESN